MQRAETAEDPPVSAWPTECGAASTDVRFMIGACSLGAVLIAVSARGVCAIHMGDAPDVLVGELRNSGFRASPAGPDAEAERWLRAVIDFIDAPVSGFDVPLDVRGTVFQRRVWAQLRRIPLGETASYADVARGIGAFGAARAVARACATNALAVAIPCHRVVCNDGRLSGYRWGVERKRALLAREGVCLSGRR